MSGTLKYSPLLILILFFGIAPFGIPMSTQAASEHILLSEIQITGGSGHTNDEFIELYNAGNTDQILTDWELRRKTQGDVSPRGTLFHTFEDNVTISAGKYFLWTNKDGATDFTDLFDVQSKNKTSPNLTDDNSLGLYDEASVLIDSVIWGSGHKSPFSPGTLYPDNPSANKSLVRSIETLVLSLSDTPSPTNSRGEAPSPIPEPTPPPAPPPTTAVKTIRFNEIFPNPSAKSDAGEFIELYNFGTESSDISGWEILDATAMKKKLDGKTLSKSDRLVFPDASVIHPGGYLIATDASPWFSLTLNNTNETLSLFDKNGIIIDSLHFDTSKENISLNHTGSGWRGGLPTPGTVNILNSLPETKEKVPKKGYRGVAVLFNTRGKDADGDTLKYTWDFGDGHKSYKKETSHTYTDNGTYQVTLTTNDGSDDVVETFTLKIESFPDTEVRITSFVPNPEGKDSEGEYLIIENREKKPVNLKGFSIATGWKKLINHPVRSDFIIAGKSEARMTRGFSLFTLPNEKGKIELRGPDGKTLQKIKYNVAGGIKDDAVYKKEKGKRWEWQEQTTQSDAMDVDSKPATEKNGLEPTPPIPEPDIQKDIPTAPPEPKKLSLLPLLNYGTNVTLPDSIQLVLDDPVATTSSISQEHYAITFAKAVLSDLNTTINQLQNAE